MTDYWGAQIYMSPSMYWGVPRYIPFENDFSDYTRPGDDERNGSSIDSINRQIMNQHPEYIAALADQWQNAYNLLASIKQQILDASNALYNEGWRAAEARDAFMMRGPGTAVAYLDEWLDAASNNVTGLRALVGVAQQSRIDMTILWNEYKQKVEDAETIDTGERWKAAFQLWKSMDDAMRDEAINDLNHVKETYDQKARDLAYGVARQYVDTFATINSGFGLKFTPMNVVLNIPGHPKWNPPSLPNRPPGGLPAAPPLPLPVMPVAPTDPRELQEALLRSLNPPLPPVVGGVRVPDPTVIAGSGRRPSLPPGLPAGTSRVAPPPGLGGLGAPGTAGAAGVGMRDGVLGRGAPAMPGGGMPGAPAAPMAPPPGRGAPAKRTPGSPLAGDDRRGLGPVPEESEETFARPPGTTAPPVLSNPRSNPRRPGSREELAPPAGGGRTGPPVPEHPDAVSPVLSSPGSNAIHATPPPPPTRRQHGADRPARPAPPPGTDWTGWDDVRSDASSGVIDAPPPAVSGTAVSGLEEVPASLRGAAAARSAPAPRHPGGTVAPELGLRRTGPGRAEDDPDREAERSSLVTDQEAFTVETPGGGTLAGSREDGTPRNEPPAALGR